MGHQFSGDAMRFFPRSRLRPLQRQATPGRTGLYEIPWFPDDPLRDLSRAWREMLEIGHLARDRGLRTIVIDAAARLPADRPRSTKSCACSGRRKHEAFPGRTAFSRRSRSEAQSPVSSRCQRPSGDGRTRGSAACRPPSVTGGADFVAAFTHQRVAATIHALADVVVLDRGFHVRGLLRLDELALEEGDVFRVVELDDVRRPVHVARDQRGNDKHVRGYHSTMMFG